MFILIYTYIFHIFNVLMKKDTLYVIVIYFISIIAIKHNMFYLPGTYYNQ